MTAFIVEYRHELSPSTWFATRERVTRDRALASTFSLSEALARVERSMRESPELGIKAAIRISRGGVFHDYALRDQPEGLREALRCVPRHRPVNPELEGDGA